MPNTQTNGCGTGSCSTTECSTSEIAVIVPSPSVNAANVSKAAVSPATGSTTQGLSHGLRVESVRIDEQGRLVATIPLTTAQAQQNLMLSYQGGNFYSDPSIVQLHNTTRVHSEGRYTIEKTNGNGGSYLTVVLDQSLLSLDLKIQGQNLSLQKDQLQAMITRGQTSSPEAPTPSVPVPEQPNPDTQALLAAKDKEISDLKSEVGSMRAQMDEMKKQMEEMRELLAGQGRALQGATPQGQASPPATPQGAAPNNAGPTNSAPLTPAPGSPAVPAPPTVQTAPPAAPGAPQGSTPQGATPVPPAAQGSQPATPSPESSTDATPQQQPPAERARPAQDIDYTARAQAMYQELSWYTGGTPLTSGAALSLSSQMKVMHQVSDLTPQQAAQLRETYQATFNRDLVSDIDAKLSVGRAAALKAKLVAFNPQELAKLMKDNIDAWIIDDPEVIVDIVTNLPFEQRQSVSTEFEKLTGKPILAKLKADYGAFDRVTIVEPFLSGLDVKGLTEAAELFQLMIGAGSNDQPLILATLQRGESSPAEIAKVFETFYAKKWSKASLLDVLAAEVDQATVDTARGFINSSAQR